MKKSIFLLAVAVILAPSAAFAAMPNFTGTGYKLAKDCVVPPDHGIYEIVDGNMTLTGCTPDADFKRSQAEAYQRNLTGVKFGVGQSVTLKTGAVEACPFWFIPSAGCIIAAELVR